MLVCHCDLDSSHKGLDINRLSEEVIYLDFGHVKFKITYFKCGHEHYFCIRLDSFNVCSKLKAAHPWHPDICYYQAIICRVYLKMFKSQQRISKAKDGIALPAQCLLEDQHYIELVVNYQYRMSRRRQLIATSL